MDNQELLRYGNELTIVGFVVGNAEETKTILFPDENYSDNWDLVVTDHELIHKIINQLDYQDIEGLQKVILRKSQRNIDSNVSWQVFRRDNFKCVYCGADDVPMTIDHIVLWEHLGDTVPNNLNCSCKKCNKTRGSMDYESWIYSAYLNQTEFKGLVGDHLTTDELLERGRIAKGLPLRKAQRSR